MMKSIYLKSILEWCFSQFLTNEKKKVANNEEKPMKNMQRLRDFLNKHFDFRYNRLTGVTEYRDKERIGKPFLPIDEREMNGMIVDARMAGISCWNSMIPILVLSSKVESFNPFQLYLDELPDTLRSYYLDNLNPCYDIPKNGEEGRWFTAAEMFRVMTQRNPAALRGISAQQLSRRLSGLGVRYKHTNHGNYYQVQVL